MLKGGKSDTLWLEGQCCMAIGGPMSSCTHAQGGPIQALRMPSPSCDSRSPFGLLLELKGVDSCE